jgi:hypothetical protein
MDSVTRVNGLTSFCGRNRNPTCYNHSNARGQGPDDRNPPTHQPEGDWFSLSGHLGVQDPVLWSGAMPRCGRPSVVLCRGSPCGQNYTLSGRRLCKSSGKRLASLDCVPLLACTLYFLIGLALTPGSQHGVENNPSPSLFPVLRPDV